MIRTVYAISTLRLALFFELFLSMQRWSEPHFLDGVKNMSLTKNHVWSDIGRYDFESPILLRQMK